MKDLKSVILERLRIDKDTKVIKMKEPVKGTKAYDYNDNEWEIKDFCKLNDKKKVDRLIQEYDLSGCFQDEFSIEDYHDTTYIVGAVNKNAEYYLGARALWVWGKDGLYYKD